MGKRTDALRLTWFDHFVIAVAPNYGLRRVRARATAQAMSRHYEAASGGRRTTGWNRSSSDANVANGPALAALREHSRDLRRNNGWAKRAIHVIANNAIGWGIVPKPGGRSKGRSDVALKYWNDWAKSTACDYDGRRNFYGLQRLAMETIVESGEVIIVRQPASSADELDIPLRIQVLEPDYLDTSKNGLTGISDGPIIDGIEFDKQGRRIAYWLFTSHPGGQRMMTTRFESVRVPAERVLHVFRIDRPGQVRGVPWLASAISRIKDLDDFEDAELMQQKIAACFGAFVTDLDGGAPAIGKETKKTDEVIEELQPGHIQYLKPGQSVTMATPPVAQDSQFSNRVLRRIAVSLDITYEDLTGDYSQVNFSSARMARISHWASVWDWRENMVIPQMCAGVWEWFMDLAMLLEGWADKPSAKWVGPPMPAIELDKEARAYQLAMRIGYMTWDQMVLEQGFDPDEHQAEIVDRLKAFDKDGVIFDCDPRRTTAAGQIQQAKPAASTSSSDGTGDSAATDGTDATDAGTSAATH